MGAETAPRGMLFAAVTLPGTRSFEEPVTKLLIKSGHEKFEVFVSKFWGTIGNMFFNYCFFEETNFNMSLFFLNIKLLTFTALRISLFLWYATGNLGFVVLLKVFWRDSFTTHHPSAGGWSFWIHPLDVRWAKLQEEGDGFWIKWYIVSCFKKFGQKGWKKGFSAKRPKKSDVFIYFFFFYQVAVKWSFIKLFRPLLC